MRSRGSKVVVGEGEAVALGGGSDGFSGGYEGFQLGGFGVGGLQLEGLVDLSLGSGEVSAAEEGDGKVVVVARVVGVGGGGALEQGDGVVTLTAGGYGLIIDDLGEGEAAGNELEGGLRFGVPGGVEAGEAEVEAGFEGAAVGGRDFGEGGGGVVVVALGELGLAEGEEGGGIVGRVLDGELQALDALLWRDCRSAADVVLEGAEPDGSGGGEEGLLGYVELGVDLPGYLPGHGVLDVEEAGEFARVLEGLRHAEVLDVEDLGLDGDAGLIDRVAADYDEVGVEGLGDADGGGARGFEVYGEAEVVEGVLAVVAGDGEEAGGGEALVQGVGEGVTDPGEVGLAGAVVEGEDEDYAAGSLRCLSGGRGLGRGEEGADDQRYGQPLFLKDATDWKEARHRYEYRASVVGDGLQSGIDDAGEAEDCGPFTLAVGLPDNLTVEEGCGLGGGQ